MPNPGGRCWSEAHSGIEDNGVCMGLIRPHRTAGLRLVGLLAALPPVQLAVAQAQPAMTAPAHRGNQIASEMSALERTVALEAIRQLKARSMRAVDTKDWDTYQSLHAPDHVSDNEGQQPVRGAAENTRRIRENAERLSLTAIHHVYEPELTLHSPVSASGVWPMEDLLYWKQGSEEHWLHGWGHYFETYEKRDGKWLFTSRRLKRTRIEMSPGATIGEYREPRNDE